MVGEELGFIGASAVALLFLILVARGLEISRKARTMEGCFLAAGMTLIIGVSAFLNMAVVLGMLPTKGLALPFFSYGGSAMIFNFACMGVILNVAGQTRLAAPPGAGGT